MQAHFFSLRIAALVIVAAIAVATLDLHWRGYAVVHDPARTITAAVLEDADGRRIAMREIAAGYWAARPRGDARFLLSCPDGTSIRRGHVAPGRRATYTLVPDDCRSRRQAVGQRA